MPALCVCRAVCVFKLACDWLSCSSLLAIYSILYSIYIYPLQAAAALEGLLFALPLSRQFRQKKEEVINCFYYASCFSCSQCTLCSTLYIFTSAARSPILWITFCSFFFLYLPKNMLDLCAMQLSWGGSSFPFYSLHCQYTARKRAFLYYKII